jgi:hypothetical protein
MNDSFLDTHPLTPFRPAHPPVLRSGGSRMAWIGGAQNENDMAFGNRVQAHGIAAGWVGFRPPPPSQIRMRIRGGGDPALPENGTALRLPRFPRPRAFLHPVRLWRPPDWSLQAARSPMGSILPLPTRRAGGHDAARLRLAGCVLRPCLGTRAAPAPVPGHLRPPLHPAPTTSRGGRGSGFRARTPRPLCGPGAHRVPVPPSVAYQPAGLADGRHRQKGSTEPRSVSLDVEFRNGIRSMESHRAVTPAQSALEGRCGFRDQ